MDQQGIIRQTTVDVSNITGERILGADIRDLLATPSQIEKFFYVMQKTLADGCGEILSYYVRDYFFLALMLPHGPDKVIVHQVRLISIRRKKRAVRFLMDIYRKKRAAG